MRTLEKRVRLADIVTLAARVWNITEKDLKGPGQNRILVHARAGVTAVARAIPTPVSFPQLGLYLGKRDHTSIINGYRKLDVYARYEGFTEKLDELFELCATEEPFVKERAEAKRAHKLALKRNRNTRAKVKLIVATAPAFPLPAKKPRNTFASDDVVKFNMMMRDGSAALSEAINAERMAA